MDTLTVLICTHNRADLLQRTLASLNAAQRPAMPVQILVAVNACTDDTTARLSACQARQGSQNLLPLRIIEVPEPGKSHALNCAIPGIATELVALVDDDHRIDEKYLVAIERATDLWPDAGLYCGRILPDWNGSEPAWVHDEGPYRIYPLPVPRYDQGVEARAITAERGPIPGGGNLVVRRSVFDLAGPFSTELGPRGHDLGGGEDSEFVFRALARGVHCQYAPDIVQHHYVDVERLKLSYLLKKSFQRTRSVARIRGNGRVPLYMWRKLAEYGFHALFSLSWSRRRFYWVRVAAAAGEVRGRRESSQRGTGLGLPHDRVTLGVAAWAVLATVCALLAWFVGGPDRWIGLLPTLAMAAAGTTALLAKSVSDFSQTGPRIRDRVVTDYRCHTIHALARLGFWAFALMTLTGGGGVLVCYALSVSIGSPWSGPLASLGAVLGILGALGLQFVHKLRLNPGLILASMHYRMSRLYPVWNWATLARIRVLQCTLACSAALLLIAASRRLLEQHRPAQLVALWAAALSYAGLIGVAAWSPDAGPRRRNRQISLPNILLIGSDTLRADRLGALGYRRLLTPNIDELAKQGTLFANCYVPCARTAPSLVSLLTGTWPHTHGIRDNFVADAEARLKVDALPRLLKPLGYRTAAISDWCGSDMGKFSFGFDYTDLPEDQWNLKYLIRQGPKDLRLFLSLFTHNRLGRLLLPELYYLGGVPLTTHLGRRARRLVSRLAASHEPFFLNVFFSTTHPPFASEWPWYTQFADPAYAGESKFAMAKLNDPFDIIRRQGAPREEFDLDQIIDLYDGCVAQFDDQVGRMLRHLEACGLTSNTIVVVYSDHGMEFFEHDTWGQGNSAVGDFSPRIPLVIQDPRHPACGLVADVVRSIDLAPTLLELVGAPRPAGMDGVSLAGCLTRHERLPQLDAFNETGLWFTDVPGLPEKHLRYPDLLELLEVPDREAGTLVVKARYLPVILKAKDRMLRHGRWKLVYQPLECGYLLRLFDVEDDPGCMHDVINAEPELVETLWRRLQQWMKSHDFPSPDHEALHPGAIESGRAPSARTNLRGELLTAARTLFDRAFGLFARRTRVLFVLTDGYGFACQSPVINALRQYPDIVVRVTTDKPRKGDDIDFASPEDRNLFNSLHLSSRRARFKKWHIRIDTHINSFYPAFNTLQAYMHHGPGFGIFGNKTGPIRQSNIFCGLSEAEFEWFKRLLPGIFDDQRVFFPVGFPKSDALCRGEIERKAVLGRLQLPDRPTFLITSHWQTQALLRCLNEAPLRKLAAAFPDCNIVQTGHPWLWQPNHDIPRDWQHRMLADIKEIESRHSNIRFVQTSDVEALLSAADLMVGDYSSVMTTYSLLDRPIVFFDNPDFEFTFAELKDVFIGASHRFAHIDELVSACRAALSDPGSKATGRARMRRVFSAHEGMSAAYMAALIQTIGRVSSTREPGWERVRALANHAR